MPESTPPESSSSEGHDVKVDIPENAQLWVALEQEEGFAPTIIVGGNPQGLRMLSNYCIALADSGISGGRMDLAAGEPLLEGSECDMLLVLQSENLPDSESS